MSVPASNMMNGGPIVSPLTGVTDPTQQAAQSGNAFQQMNPQQRMMMAQMLMNMGKQGGQPTQMPQMQPTTIPASPMMR